MKTQEKSLELSSCHHFFTIKLHLAKTGTTTDVTAANGMHKMTAWTIKSGMCHTAKSEQPDALSPPLCKMWYRALLERRFFCCRHSHRHVIICRSDGPAWDLSPVCDTVFWAAIHSAENLVDYHLDIKLVVQILRMSVLYLQECPQLICISDSLVMLWVKQELWLQVYSKAAH